MAVIEKQYPKKITVRTVHLDTADCEAIAENLGKKKPVSVLRVGGSIEKAESQTSHLGTYMKYTGRFAALNLTENIEYRSKVMILPAVAESALQDLIDKVKKDDNEAQIEFALDITLEYYNNPNTEGTRFRYGVKPLRDPGEDSLSKLLQSFGEPPLISFNQEQAPKETGAKAKAKR